MLRRAVDVGAQVEHVGFAFQGRQYAGDGGTVYSGMVFSKRVAQGRRRRRDAGFADASRRFAALDQIDGDAHGGVLLAAQRRRGGLVHAYRLGRVVQAQVRAWRSAVRLQFGSDRFLQSDQNDIATRVRFLEIKRGRNGYAGAVIAPHAIDGYRGVHAVMR
jgi:hypothetical protein